MYFKNEIENGYKIKYIIRNITIRLNDIIKNTEVQKDDFNVFKENTKSYINLTKDFNL